MTARIVDLTVGDVVGGYLLGCAIVIVFGAAWWAWLWWRWKKTMRSPGRP